MKTKTLAKFVWLDGFFVLLHCPKRVMTSVVYQSFKDVILDFPLNMFDVKIVECDNDKYADLICPF